MGNRNTLMMAWKPCVESIRQAMKKPSAVRAIEMTNIKHDRGDQTRTASAR